MAGFVLPGSYPYGSPYPTPQQPTGPTSRPTPYAGPGTPGASPYVSQEAEAQRQRETLRLQQEAALKAQSQAEKSRLGEQTEAERAAADARTQEARLQAEAEERRMAAMSPYFQSMMGGLSGGGSGNIPPQVQYGGADTARQAAFARAKDQAANIARSALTGLQNVMASRGISGSGIELGRTGEILGAGASGLGDINREQLIQDLAAQQHMADVAYQGGIEQRGQDIQAQQAQRAALQGLFNQMFSGNLTARY